MADTLKSGFDKDSISGSEVSNGFFVGKSAGVSTSECLVPLPRQRFASGDAEAQSCPVIMETNYKCSEGHEFVSQSSFDRSEILCRFCYNELYTANINMAKKVGQSKRIDQLS